MALAFDEDKGIPDTLNDRVHAYIPLVIVNMKPQNILASAVLLAATVASLAVVVLGAIQLRPERAATAVLVDTATIAQLNGMRSATVQLSGDQQEDFLRRNGIASIDALQRTFASEETDFDNDQIARHRELERRDQNVVLLMTLASFSSAACAMGTILLIQEYRKSSAASKPLSK